MRVKAVISYDGSAFYGFQRQASTPLTVTQQIEKVLKNLQINTTITGSGRTDRGVHATGQVIHFDLPPFWRDLNKLKLILNRRLSAISFRDIVSVSPSFHARFSAQKRLYRYIFKSEPLSVFERKYVACYPEIEHKEILIRALNAFCGTHDFLYFHKTGSDIHTTVRTIYSAHYYTYKNYHVITFKANGFLRSQVRLMVDAAMSCAKGNITLEMLQAQIACKMQLHTTLAPAEGLYLSKIYY
jgi:tRNA pseudouridine38-40 synthase